MTTFNQDTKDRGQKMLDALIAMATQGAIDACAAGEDDARDKLYMGIGHLYAVKGILGGVSGPDVSTRGGDK